MKEKKLVTLDNVIDHFLGQKWSEREVKGKKFDDLFQIDGIPLSWFLRRHLVLHVIPHKFDTARLLGNFDGNLTFSTSEKLKYSSKLLFYRKGLNLNEKMKIIFSRKKNIKKEKIEGDNILFLIPTNHYDQRKKTVFRVNKVIEEVRNLGMKPSILIFDPLSRRSYRQLKSCEDTIYDYVNENAVNKAKNLSKKLFKQWKEISIEEKKKLFSFEDKSLWDYLQYPLNFFFSEEFLFYQCLYYETLHHVVKEKITKAIVMTSQNSIFEKAMLVVAKLHNIPVVLVQHGLAEGVVNPDILENTKLAVFGNLNRERLLRVGVAEEDIKIVGPIIFDDVAEFKNVKKKKEEKNVLLITEPMVERNLVPEEKYFNYIKKLVKEICSLDVSLTIKLHPSEIYLEKYQEIVSEFKNVNVSQELGSKYLYHLISQADLIVEFGSTVALEAMILDKAVITTNLCQASGNYSIIKNSQATYEVDYNEDISKKIREVLENDILKEKRDKFVRHVCGEVDGKASERVAIMINNLIEVEDGPRYF